MATYNSAQNGNWNTDATWNEAGHPDGNDDVTIITHEVTYDVGVSAITWGNCTLNSGGVLIFPIGSSSKILFNATGILRVNSGGELRAGTSGAPVAAANTCLFHWPQGASARYNFILTNGGIINIYGDPTYYGSTKYADLDSDWTAGQTLYVTGDFSSTWVAGQTFYINKNAGYSSYLTDGDTFTIDTVGAYDVGNDKTPITIVEAAPEVTFAATNKGHTSKLIMSSRNVVLADPGADLIVGSVGSYTERLWFDNNQATANYNINIQDALYYGWYRCSDGGYNFQGENLVFINNVSGFYEGWNHSLNIDIISGSYGCYQGFNYLITGNLANINYAVRSGVSYKIVGDLVSNNIALNTCQNMEVVGNLVSNNVGDSGGLSDSLRGNCTANTTGINQSTKYLLKGADADNTTDVNVTNSLLKKSVVFEDCTLAAADRFNFRVYQNCGNWLPLDSGDGDWQAPPSGEAWILQATPNTNCRDSWGMQMELSPLNDMADYVTSGSKTLTVSIYPSGWASPLDQDDIVLEVKYLDSAAGVTRTTVTNTSNTYANGGWRDLQATFNPSQDGVVYFNVYLRLYESACYVLIDPEWSIA